MPTTKKTIEIRKEIEFPFPQGVVSKGSLLSISAAFNSDYSLLALADYTPGFRAFIRVINPLNYQSKNEISEITAHKHPVFVLCWSNYVAKLIAASRDRVTVLQKAGNSLTNLKEYGPFFHSDVEDDVCSIALNDDAKRLAIGFFGSIRLVDLETDKVKMCFDSYDQMSYDALCFNQTGSEIISGSSNGVITVWDCLTLDRTNNLKRKHYFKEKHPRGHVKILTLNSDGLRLATGTLGGQIKVWDTQNQECISTINHEECFDTKALAFSTDSLTLVGGFANGKVMVFNVKTASVIQKLSYDAHYIRAVAMSADGGRIMAMLDTNTLAVVEKVE